MPIAFFARIVIVRVPAIAANGEQVAISRLWGDGQFR